MKNEVTIIRHEVISIPLPNGQIKSELGKELRYRCTFDKDKQRLIVNDKYMKFKQEEDSKFAYQIRKTFIRSYKDISTFFKEFFDDKFGWSDVMIHAISRYGKPVPADDEEKKHNKKH